MIRRIARPLLGSIFVYSGYNHLRNPAPTAKAAAPLTTKAENALPESPIVPSGPDAWVRTIGGVQLGGGLLLAANKFPRISALALAGTLVPETAVEHDFWNQTDPEAKQRATVDFLKNASIVGGLIIAGFDTEGKPGVVWRTKRVAGVASDKASAAVASVRPGAEASASAFAPVLRERAHEAGEVAQDAASKVGHQLGQAREAAGKYAAQAEKKAAPVVSDLADTAAAKASELASVAQERLAEARDRAPGLAEAARERLEDARDRAPGLAESARGRFDDARDRAPGLAESARDRLLEARDRAPELADSARGLIGKPKKKRSRIPFFS